jgi:hypothetical protein
MWREMSVPRRPNTAVVTSPVRPRKTPVSSAGAKRAFPNYDTFPAHRRLGRAGSEASRRKTLSTKFSKAKNSRKTRKRPVGFSSCVSWAFFVSWLSWFIRVARCVAARRACPQPEHHARNSRKLKAHERHERDPGFSSCVSWAFSFRAFRGFIRQHEIHES